MERDFDKIYPNWRKAITQDDKEIRRIEKAQERFERRENRKDLKELKKLEKEFDKGLDL